MKKLTLAALLCMAWMGEAGNGNVIVGNGNTVNGDKNGIKGNGNVQVGDQTRIVGSNNFNEGNNRQILGDNQYVSSEHPEYQIYQSQGEDFGPTHPHRASFDSSVSVNQGSGFGSHLTSEPVVDPVDPQVLQDTAQGNVGAQVLNSFTSDFLEAKRQEIIHELQSRIQERMKFNNN